MNAILEAKQSLASDWVSSAPVVSDWRAARLEESRKWLLAHGGPHARDHYWSYTDPKLLDASTGSLNVAMPSFAGTAILPTTKTSSDALKITPIEEAENKLFGRLVASAHGRGARPLAEKTLLSAQGVYIEVMGDGGVLTIDRDVWPDDIYLGITVASGATLTIIETGAKSSTKNMVVEAELADGASFHHIRIAAALEDKFHAHLFAELGANCDLRSFSFSGAGHLHRFESVVDLLGDNSHVSIAGADLLMNKGHQDDTVYITHDALNCNSRQVFKRVVTEGATSVFQGKILVKEDAQKTDGYQISQGLMLEDGAEILSKPELEIYADDVACSHGSTTSGMDETALFYLRSRGVPMNEARQLLVRAFIEEAIEEIHSEDLREQIGAMSEEWIFGQAL